ncbi:MAG: antirestriction protein ArdR [gamma proteobacterium symbiont of Bathyaustriella thionipta]|nr:antirestriction protein ArdR [gamma proteobacterium symbiont of Bathyaustriella thionipta]MCU7953061.1 antirestriction protein ArdR [gamma proteobacterium symbiont of Bathyaustriella thionipta]MCU7957572.1 antirestriction protein ArdR [gamma proteobacterium symbiont of Bathyaustriella thionipta]MCU7965846.1 antirestriction protein ArdR [gamma proteobacterium symbiont of Bathyaustriella thionipta]
MLNYITIAKEWRMSKTEKHSTKGVVLIWDGQVYGWKNCLRDAKHERPGAIAVDIEEHVFIAQGGNDYDGAKCWVAQ